MLIQVAPTGSDRQDHVTVSKATVTCQRSGVSKTNEFDHANFKMKLCEVGISATF